jgi:hypothetical protein
MDGGAETKPGMDPWLEATSSSSASWTIRPGVGGTMRPGVGGNKCSGLGAIMPSFVINCFKTIDVYRISITKHMCFCKISMTKQYL